MSTLCKLYIRPFPAHPPHCSPLTPLPALPLYPPSLSPSPLQLPLHISISYSAFFTNHSLKLNCCELVSGVNLYSISNGEPQLISNRKCPMTSCLSMFISSCKVKCVFRTFRLLMNIKYFDRMDKGILASCYRCSFVTFQRGFIQLSNVNRVYYPRAPARVTNLDVT